MSKMNYFDFYEQKKSELNHPKLEEMLDLFKEDLQFIFKCYQKQSVAPHELAKGLSLLFLPTFTEESYDYCENDLPDLLGVGETMKEKIFQTFLQSAGYVQSFIYGHEQYKNNIEQIENPLTADEYKKLFLGFMSKIAKELRSLQISQSDTPAKKRSRPGVFAHSNKATGGAPAPGLK
mgnify:CR=1 FL=1